MNIPVGRCGHCGGQVTIPRVWMAVVPLVPQCQACHATAKPQGPVLDMNPPPLAVAARRPQMLATGFRRRW